MSFYMPCEHWTKESGLTNDVVFIEKTNSSSRKVQRKRFTRYKEMRLPC